MGMLAAHDALPSGDFRDWTAIDTFARAVAGELELARDSMTPQPRAAAGRYRRPRVVPKVRRRRSPDGHRQRAARSTRSRRRRAAIALLDCRPPHVARIRISETAAAPTASPRHQPAWPAIPAAAATKPARATSASADVSHWSDPRRASPTAAMSDPTPRVEQRASTGMNRTWPTPWANTASGDDPSPDFTGHRLPPFGRWRHRRRPKTGTTTAVRHAVGAEGPRAWPSAGDGRQARRAGPVSSPVSRSATVPSALTTTQ